MKELAVTEVLATVTDPAVIAALVPTVALDPVAMEILFPAVPKTKFPFVAVMAPKVAVTVVVATRAVPAVIVVVEAMLPGAMNVAGIVKVEVPAV